MFGLKPGVINFTSITSTPTLLDLRISEFKLDGAKTVDEAVDQLLSRREVREQIAQSNLTRRGRQVGIGNLARPSSNQVAAKREINLNSRNITVREVLNEIARKHGSAVWSYHEQECDGQTLFSINFLVE